MANMTLNSLTTAVYTSTGLDTTDTMVTSSVATAFVNQAIHRIEIEHDWPWLQTVETLTTTASQNYVTVATNWLRTRSLTVAATNLSVDEIPVDEYDAQVSAAQSTSPDVFCVWQDRIMLWPVPSSAYTLTHRYIKQEPDLSAASDEPLMPNSFRPSIVEYASFLALERVRSMDRAQEAQQRWQDWMLQMKDNRRRTTQPTMPRVRAGSWL